MNQENKHIFFEELKESFFDSFLQHSLEINKQKSTNLPVLFLSCFHIKTEIFSTINSFLDPKREVNYELALMMVASIIEYNIKYFYADTKEEYLNQIKNKIQFIDIENNNETSLEFLFPLLRIDNIVNNILLHLNGSKIQIDKNKYEVQLREISLHDLTEFISKLLSWIYLDR